jgi:histidyl-tRNA synthetase
VRGLDYYTRTTFEFSCDRLGAQSGVGGGGRYDGLVERIGGPPTPGVGFGSGLERITFAMGERDYAAAGLDAYIVCFDEARRDDAFVLAEGLRRELLLAADLDLAGRSPKGQLRHAARLRATAAVMVGLDELDSDQVRVRLLDGGEEADLRRDGLAAWLADRVGKGRP